MKYTNKNCSLCSKELIDSNEPYEVMKINYNGINVIFCNFSCAYKYHVFNKNIFDQRSMVLQLIQVIRDGEVIWEKLN